MIKINCDLCGKQTEESFKVVIESVELEVCKDCAKFGMVIAPVRRPSAKEQHRQFMQRQSLQQPKEEKIEIIVDNFPELVKKKRESMNLSQKDFAIKLNEKESIIHKIETGSFEPSLELARKLEKILHIKLIEDHEEKFDGPKSKKGIGFTLGDFIKVKK